MKKTYDILAVLTILLLATVFSSCNKENPDLSDGRNVTLTITITSPATDATKITTSTDDGTSPISVTGWVLGDVVDLYKLGTSDDVYTKVEFTCTDPSSSKFTGTLPTGVNVEDLTLALYNSTLDYYYYDPVNSSDIYFRLLPAAKASTDVKDVIMLAGIKSGGSFNLKVINNIVKARNSTSSDIEGIWKIHTSFYDYYTKMCVRLYQNGDLSPEYTTGPKGSSSFGEGKLTLSANSDNYLFMFPGSSSLTGDIGLGTGPDNADADLIDWKALASLSATGGKIYRAPAI